MIRGKIFLLIVIAFVCQLYIPLHAIAQETESYYYKSWIYESESYRDVKFKVVDKPIEYITKFPLETLLSDPKILEINNAYRGNFRPLEKLIIVEDEEGKTSDVYMSFFIYNSREDAEWGYIEKNRLFGSWYFEIHSSEVGRDGELGDNSWISPPNNYNISFIRNNVLVMLDNDYNNEIGADVIPYIASKIDSLLLEEETVSNPDLLPTPKIQSINLLSGNLTPDTRPWFIIQATDPNNRNLRYRMMGGADTAINERSVTIGDNQTYVKCWVTNEDSYVSSIDYFFPTTSVSEDTASNPTLFTLFQNTPNPFNPATAIRYDLHEAADVRLVVYDMLGRAITTLVDEPLSAGNHSAQFDGTGLSSGVYVYRLSVGGKSETGRMTLVK